MDFFAIRIEILETKLSLAFDLVHVASRSFTGNAAKPADSSVVVVCSGVDNHVFVIVVWQIDILRVAAKRKLKNPHAGKVEIVAQRFNIGRNHAKVFGNNRQFTQLISDRCEQFSSRRFNPTATFRGLISARYFPTRSEAAKVIDAGDIEHLQGGVYSPDPPLEAVRKHLVPVVKWISPELTGSAEVIRRHAGYYNRRPTCVQLKLIRIGPNVRRIMGHKNWNIAN